MVSAGDGAIGTGGRSAGPMVQLPAPEPIDQERLEARRQEAAEFEALIGRVANGDQEALGTLYDKSGARIYGLLLRLLRAPGQAAKLTEEVFVEVWQQARRYHPSQGMVFAWIVAIAHQRGITCLKAAAGEGEPRPAGAPPAAGNVSREIDEVWAVIEQRFGSARVRAGLKALSWVHRQALLLAYFEGYSQQQIATHLGISLHAVRLEMRNGLAALVRALGVADD
jgi:RNA polymerase sigma-70 factor, ECF subfamily